MVNTFPQKNIKNSQNNNDINITSEVNGYEITISNIRPLFASTEKDISNKVYVTIFKEGEIDFTYELGVNKNLNLPDSNNPEERDFHYITFVRNKGCKNLSEYSTKNPIKAENYFSYELNTKSPEFCTNSYINILENSENNVILNTKSKIKNAVIDNNNLLVQPESTDYEIIVPNKNLYISFKYEPQTKNNSAQILNYKARELTSEETLAAVGEIAKITMGEVPFTGRFGNSVNNNNNIPKIPKSAVRD